MREASVFSSNYLQDRDYMYLPKCQTFPLNTYTKWPLLAQTPAALASKSHKHSAWWVDCLRKMSGNVYKFKSPLLNHFPAIKENLTQKIHAVVCFVICTLPRCQQPWLEPVIWALSQNVPPWKENHDNVCHNHTVGRHLVKSTNLF